MQFPLPLLLVLTIVNTLISQSFTCSTASTHAHDAIREGEIQISSWSGCTMSGTIAGASVQLWADGSSCPLHEKVPGTFQVRYDATCGQVIDLSDGPLPPYCPMPTATPTPVPSPTPTPEACAINAPASVTLPAHSNGTVDVSFTSTSPRTVTITAVSSSGQLVVTPSSVIVSGTSDVARFTLRTRRNGAQVTFSSVCGTQVTTVSVVSANRLR
jgi:hypothetical protein